jgi:NAD(P)-dependent dehydrogenase (short-subunit alcohol dehydrogenase family)
MTDMRPTALVTGATRGIGFGIAEQLALNGYDLIVNGTRDEAQVSEAVDALARHGGRVIYVQADISRAEDRESLVDRARHEFTYLNLLVNNAGVAPNQRADIMDATEASWDRLMSINLQGPFFLTQNAAHLMAAQKKIHTDLPASIIFVTSVSAFVPSVNRGDYCVSKAGLSMAARLWSVRLAEYGVPVYEIQPGLIKTDMTAAVTDKYDAMIQGGALLQPRWGTPEDIGRAVCMLASGDLPYATGQVLIMDGGLTAHRL